MSSRAARCSGSTARSSAAPSAAKAIARAWKHILGGVRGFQDLDPELLGRVEELIDFVTQEGAR